MGSSLAADADILLYGCSIASTDAGKAFVEQFASITQADIGASTNLTGKAGDEVLEFQVGQVSNALIASAINYESANLTLAQFTVITTADSGPGSLRQSIIDSNATSANDEIIFASALFTNGAITTITLQTALPSIATTLSAGSLTITGSGASALTVSGDNGDTNRNFNIFNIDSGGNLTISGVTVSGAKLPALAVPLITPASLTSQILPYLTIPQHLAGLLKTLVAPSSPSQIPPSSAIPHHLAVASTIMAALSLLLVPPSLAILLHIRVAVVAFTAVVHPPSPTLSSPIAPGAILLALHQRRARITLLLRALCQAQPRLPVNNSISALYKTTAALLLPLP